jgi:SAM-dependent methyltransferase
MHLDVVEYRKFYDSPLGHVALRMIRRRLRVMWPNTKGQSVLGVGYATPYLGPFRLDAERVIAFMPAQQGVAPWPRGGAGLTALTEEDNFPLPDSSIDRIILAHAVENTEMLRALLRQVWRVLAPAGRVIVIAPNRASLWTQLESTPFSHGRPFTRSQLERTLRDAMFTPVAWDRALCLPPLKWRWSLRYGQALENMGQSLWPRFAGVVIAEATKEVYAALPSGGVPVRARIWAPEPKGAQASTPALFGQQQDRALGRQIVPTAGIDDVARISVLGEGDGALDLDAHGAGEGDEVRDAAQMNVRRLVPCV